MGGWAQKGQKRPYSAVTMKVTPLHKSQSSKRLRKSGLHPFVLLLQPASTELVRVMGNLAQIQHHYRVKRGPPEKWLRASFQNWEPSFQPLFFEAAILPQSPLTSSTYQLREPIHVHMLDQITPVSGALGWIRNFSDGPEAL